MDAMLRSLTRRAAHRRHAAEAAEGLRLEIERLRAEVHALRAAGDGTAVTRAELDELKAEIDECRRDNLRIAELYDLTVERLGTPSAQ